MPTTVDGAFAAIKDHPRFQVLGAEDRQSAWAVASAIYDRATAAADAEFARTGRAERGRLARHITDMIMRWAAPRFPDSF